MSLSNVKLIFDQTPDKTEHKHSTSNQQKPTITERVSDKIKRINEMTMMVARVSWRKNTEVLQRRIKQRKPVDLRWNSHRSCIPVLRSTQLGSDHPHHVTEIMMMVSFRRGGSWRKQWWEIIDSAITSTLHNRQRRMCGIVKNKNSMTAYVH